MGVEDQFPGEGGSLRPQWVGSLSPGSFYDRTLMEEGPLCPVTVRVEVYTPHSVFVGGEAKGVGLRSLAIF